MFKIFALVCGFSRAVFNILQRETSKFGHEVFDALCVQPQFVFFLNID